MNSLICLLTVFHVFKLIQRRIFIPKTTKRLIYLGILLPLGDYLLRFLLGDVWFYSGDLIFHSFLYQALFWSVIALMYWVYSRDLYVSLHFYYPLLGLFFYLLFSLFGTEHLRFWSPFSSYSLHLDWISSGYLIPLTVAFLFRLTKRWSEFSSVTIGRISLSVLVLFLVAAGVIRTNAKSEIPDRFKNSGIVSILPANNLQTEWDVVIYRDAVYHAGRYHFVQGYLEEFKQINAYDDYNTSQSVLLDPQIRNLYLFGFNNPLMTTEIQNKVLRIVLQELNPSTALLWTRQIEIFRNSSGQIVDIRVHYGTFI